MVRRSRNRCPGSHPFALTTTLVTNQEPSHGGNGARRPVEDPKDLRFELPPGLVGNPDAAAQCSIAQFDATVPEGPDLCPASSAVGVATVTVREPGLFGIFTKTGPVFNLEPGYGEPARFGFEVFGLVFVTIDVSVSAEHEYRVITSVERADQSAGLLSAQVTIWGVPGARSHDASRGWECIEGGTHDHEVGRTCPASSEEPATPFLISPTACATNPASEPLSFPLRMDSWDDPELFVSPPAAVFSNALGEPVGLEGCAGLPFTPALEAAPESHEASSPSGLAVNVRLPQTGTLEANPEGRAEADVKDTTITLPEGVQVNPSAANGLQACSEGQIGYQDMSETGVQRFTGAEPACPGASKVGAVHIRTPLLAHELEGALYLAEPAPNGEAGKNPFSSLIALYLVAEDREAGVLVKLAGQGQLDEATGQLSTTFDDTPQLPFEELKVELFGGQRASLSTPALCGDYAASSSFVSWSGASSKPSSEPPFVVASGAGGAACPSSPLAFSPSFEGGVSDAQAGAFTPFVLELARPDGQQALDGVSVQLPAGVAVLLSNVTPCQEPPLGTEWSCGEESSIGHATVQSGVGSEPVVLGGNAYLTTGYDGAPFGLLVRTLAQAGPFDLGWVNVRSRINVNPNTAAVTVTSDPDPRGEALPTMLKGIPVQLKHLQVTVDRPDFEFNPTNCAPMSINGTLTGAEGASASVSSHFQVQGCSSLPFAPVFTASAVGQGSKADGTTFKVTVRSGGTNANGVAQAGIAKVDLQLPMQLSSRLPTLQKACVASVFETDPASCDEDSVVGYATIDTPVLKNPLTGPAYLVSYGGAAFPDVEFVLQGEGITLILDGKTDIKNGITYSKFESAPDAPFTSFETILPAGPHSILTPNVPEAEDFSLCKQTLAMPTVITAQNGALIEQNTPIAITGCGEVKGSKASKPTRAQLLAKALAACRKHDKHDKRKRRACEAQAHKRYAPSKTTHKAKSTAHKAKKRA
jgi:hypothetical protein